MTTPYVPVVPNRTSVQNRNVPTFVNASELKLGDIVRFGTGGSYSDATVKNTCIQEGLVTLFRPYVHTSDFSHTGGVTCYIGIEEFTIPLSSDMKFTRIYLAPKPK